MTCGVCHPKSFRDTPGRVFGYMVADTPARAVDEAKPLYYLGCEFVFCDLPIGNVQHRPELKKMRRAVRAVDKIIVPTLMVLGSTRDLQAQRLAEFEADGIRVFVLTDHARHSHRPHLAIVA